MATPKKDFLLTIISFLIFLLIIIFTDSKLIDINTTSLIGNENSCTSNWQCDSWTVCDSQGKSYRKCINLNNCEGFTHPSTNRDCTLTPEMLSEYQNDYEKKLFFIGGDKSKIKIDFTRGIPAQNDESCQYINGVTPSCYYFNLPGNISINFLDDSISENTASGKMIFTKENTRKEIITGIGSIKEPLTKNSVGFYIYPTSEKNTFYIVGDRKTENNIMSWKEIYFDVLKQDIVFYADAGVELGNTRKSFINVKRGSTEEYDISINLPDNCTYPEKYELNSVFINGKNNHIFPDYLKFDCNQDGISYDSAIEIEPLALSDNFETLHLFVHKYKNNQNSKDDIEWHYLFDLAAGTMKFDNNN